LELFRQKLLNVRMRCCKAVGLLTLISHAVSLRERCSRWTDFVRANERPRQLL